MPGIQMNFFQRNPIVHILAIALGLWAIIFYLFHLVRT